MNKLAPLATTSPELLKRKNKNILSLKLNNKFINLLNYLYYLGKTTKTMKSIINCKL